MYFHAQYKTYFEFRTCPARKQAAHQREVGSNTTQNTVKLLRFYNKK